MTLSDKITKYRNNLSPEGQEVFDKLPPDAQAIFVTHSPKEIMEMRKNHKRRQKEIPQLRKEWKLNQPLQIKPIISEKVTATVQAKWNTIIQNFEEHASRVCKGIANNNIEDAQLAIDICQNAEWLAQNSSYFINEKEMEERLGDIMLDGLAQLADIGVDPRVAIGSQDNIVN